MTDQMERLQTFLGQLKKRDDIQGYSEINTKQFIILPTLQYLGWNPFNPEEVKPEYGIAEKRVDYALFLYQRPVVFIEVKKVGEPLAPHQEQLIVYATRESVRLAVLTNGLAWWLYLPLVEGGWDTKRFCDVDVSARDPRQSCAVLSRYLARSDVSSGDAVRIAEEILNQRRKSAVVRDSLPVAWNRLVQDRDSGLAELLRETTQRLCGYDVEADVATAFIQKHQTQFLVRSSERPRLPSRDESRKTIAGHPNPQPVHLPTGRARATSLRVSLNWELLGMRRPVEVIEHGQAVDVFLRTLRRLADHVGEPRFRSLRSFRVNRGMLLSDQRTRYHIRELLGYHVLTYSATLEKATILRAVVAEFGLPSDFLSVEIVGADHEGYRER